jgi:hypothetical protein
MIRPLRKLHRRAFGGIAVVVPLLVVTALASRTPQPGRSALPVDARAAERGSNVVLESPELWRSVAIGTRVVTSEGGGYEVELSADGISGQPDLLLYWSDEDSVGVLPESSRLLGAYSGGTRRFAMPSGIDPRDGMFILYSLAHRSVFATAEVPSNGR